MTLGLPSVGMAPLAISRHSPVDPRKKQREKKWEETANSLQVLVGKLHSYTLVARRLLGRLVAPYDLPSARLYGERVRLTP